MRAARWLAAALLAAAGAALAAPPAQPHVAHVSRYSALVSESAELLDPNADFTVEAWLWLEEVRGGTRLLGQAVNADGAPAQAFMLLVGGGEPHSIALLASNGSEERYIASPDAVLAHRWIHVAARRAAGQLELFVDGAQVGSQPAIALRTQGRLPWTFGGMPGDVGLDGFNGFAGNLRRVRLWQRALSPGEINASAASEPAANAPGLVASWPLDEGLGRAAANRVAGGAGLRFGGDFSNPPCAATPGLVGRTCVADPGWRRTAIVDAGPFFVAAPPVALLPPESPFRIAYAALLDLGRDGDPDVFAPTARFPDWPKAPHFVAVNDAGTLRDGTAQVLGATDAWTRGPRALVVADFDRDGDEDVVVADQGYDNGASPGGHGRLLLQNPDGTLADATDARLPLFSQFAHSACAGDLDGDADPDLVIGSIGGGPLGFPGPWQSTRLMRNDGSGRFAFARLFPWQSGPSWLRREQQGWGCGILDAEGDGDLDLALMAGAGVGGLDVLLANGGSGVFAEIPLPPRRRGPGARSDVVAGDVDGDGLDDLVGWETGTGAAPLDGQFLWISRGDGTFHDATATLPDTQRSSRSFIVDLDGDGRRDLVNAHSSYDAAAALLLNRGDCRFVDASQFLPAANWLVAVGDMDGDGALDLVNLMDDGPFPGQSRGVQVLRQARPIDLSLLGDVPLPPGGCLPRPDDVFADGFEVRTGTQGG